LRTGAPERGATPFLPAQVNGDKVELPFCTVDIPAGVLRGHQVRRRRQAAEGQTFRAKIDVVEWLGNEQYAYIPFDAPPEVARQLAELDGEALRTQLVVSLDGPAPCTGVRTPSCSSTRRECTFSTRRAGRT
jgi:hypothetical protein